VPFNLISREDDPTLMPNVPVTATNDELEISEGETTKLKYIAAAVNLRIKGFFSKEKRGEGFKSHHIR
jgi:hypothetical protein